GDRATAGGRSLAWRNGMPFPAGRIFWTEGGRPDSNPPLQLLLVPERSAVFLPVLKAPPTEPIAARMLGFVDRRRTSVDDAVSRAPSAAAPGGDATLAEQ